jgi:membrane protease YdiL (CAAX protease family)
MGSRAGLNNALSFLAALSRDWFTFPFGLLYRHLAAGGFFFVALGLLTLFNSFHIAICPGCAELFKSVLSIGLTLVLIVLTWLGYGLAHAKFRFDWGVGLSNWSWLGLIVGVALSAGGQVSYLLIMRQSGYAPSDVILGAVTVSGILGTLLTALSEEILFRLCFFQISAEVSSVSFGLLVSSLLFGVFHADTYSAEYGIPIGMAFIPAFLGGLMFVYAYRVHQKLWLPVGLHFGWNYFSGIFDSGVLSNTPAPVKLIVQMAMVVVIMVILVEWMLWQRRKNRPQLSTALTSTKV